MLVERQGDVELVDLLAFQDVAHLGERPQQRQPSIALAVAGAVVDEADDAVAELAMMEHLVHDVTGDVAGSRDENPLEAHTLAPLPLQRGPDRGAGRISEDRAEHQEQRPHHPGHFVHTLVLQRGGDEVGLEDERSHEAEHDGYQSADEHREEVVDPGSDALVAVGSVHPETEWEQQSDERCELQVILDVGLALGHRDQLGFEPEQIGGRERRHADAAVDHRLDEHAHPGALGH